MTTSTDTPIVESTPKSVGNPAGINLRYTPPPKEEKKEVIIQKARNGRDPKENIKKFY